MQTRQPRWSDLNARTILSTRCVRVRQLTGASTSIVVSDVCADIAFVLFGCLRQGDLHGSVQQVQLLLEENKDSAAVEVLGSWLDQARARCLVSQAVQILQARAATVAETLV